MKKTTFFKQNYRDIMAIMTEKEYYQFVEDNSKHAFKIAINIFNVALAEPYVYRIFRRIKNNV